MVRLCHHCSFLKEVEVANTAHFTQKAYRPVLKDTESPTVPEILFGIFIFNGYWHCFIVIVFTRLSHYYMDIWMILVTFDDTSYNNVYLIIPTFPWIWQLCTEFSEDASCYTIVRVSHVIKNSRCQWTQTWVYRILKLWLSVLYYKPLIIPKFQEYS